MKKQEQSFTSDIVAGVALLVLVTILMLPVAIAISALVHTIGAYL